MKLESYDRDGVRVWLEDGVLAREVPLGDGTCGGFHKNGTLKFEFQIVNGETEGICREWHDNGKLAVEKTRVSGEISGTIRTWGRKGNLEQELEYITPSAIYGKSYDGSGKILRIYLWNGKPRSKKRWLKSVLASGFDRSELERRFDPIEKPDDRNETQPKDTGKT